MKKPNRLQVAIKAFWAILRNRPHAFCDEQVRSVIGDYQQMKEFQHNINDLYGQSVQTQLWIKQVKDILNENN